MEDSSYKHLKYIMPIFGFTCGTWGREPARPVSNGRMPQEATQYLSE
ncbi:MAG TPA: hypothetical protein PLC84_04305 [Methanosarcina thermophila]|nr:hypothetical protein [Methanosarcina thermophila]NLU57547.1 hypothetical protein [Methanosarcina thermophila]HOA67946.1 hypothetical protein [Methanosarcina thermophila]HPZ19517.1 hypothetical protein [Methanosarcina thermophila]